MNDTTPETTLPQHAPAPGPAELTRLNAALTSPALKPTLHYIDQDGKAVAGPAQAWGVMVQSAQGVVEICVAPINQAPERTRMLAAYGAMALARDTIRRANAPIAELSARIDRITTAPLAWGDEKPARAVKPRLSAEEKLSAEIDLLLEAAVSARAQIGQPIQDVAAARQKLVSGANGLSASAYRAKVKRDPRVKAELERRKVAAGGPVPDTSITDL